MENNVGLFIPWFCFPPLTQADFSDVGLSKFLFIQYKCCKPNSLQNKLRHSNPNLANSFMLLVLKNLSLTLNFSLGTLGLRLIDILC